MNIDDFTYVSTVSAEVMSSYAHRQHLRDVDKMPEIIFCTFAVLGGRVPDSF